MGILRIEHVARLTLPLFWTAALAAPVVIDANNDPNNNLNSLPQKISDGRLNANQLIGCYAQGGTRFYREVFLGNSQPSPAIKALENLSTPPKAIKEPNFDFVPKKTLRDEMSGALEYVLRSYNLRNFAAQLFNKQGAQLRFVQYDRSIRGQISIEKNHLLPIYALPDMNIEQMPNIKPYNNGESLDFDSEVQIFDGSGQLSSAWPILVIKTEDINKAATMVGFVPRDSVSSNEDICGYRSSRGNEYVRTNPSQIETAQKTILDYNPFSDYGLFPGGDIPALIAPDSVGIAKNEYFRNWAVQMKVYGATVKIRTYSDYARGRVSNSGAIPHLVPEQDGFKLKETASVSPGSGSGWLSEVIVKVPDGSSTKWMVQSVASDSDGLPEQFAQAVNKPDRYLTFLRVGDSDFEGTEVRQESFPDIKDEVDFDSNRSYIGVEPFEPKPITDLDLLTRSEIGRWKEQVLKQGDTPLIVEFSEPATATVTSDEDLEQYWSPHGQRAYDDMYSKGESFETTYEFDTARDGKIIERWIATGKPFPFSGTLATPVVPVDIEDATNNQTKIFIDLPIPAHRSVYEATHNGVRLLEEF